MSTTSTFRVLTLDGGGTKGFYTLGVLRELESLWGEPLSGRFDLIYGTSTGAIIASLLGLGRKVEEILASYAELGPMVMSHRFAGSRTKALKECADRIFGDTSFSDFQTRVGIVATNMDRSRPIIFKSHDTQAHSMRHSFSPGFGVPVRDAVVASCAAYPFFKKHKLPAAIQGGAIVIDGGFCANNPTLFALADCLNALQVPAESLRVLSIGVGHYAKPRSRSILAKLIGLLGFVDVFKATLETSTNTLETIRRLCFSHIKTIRIDNSYPDQKYASDLLERNLEHLRKLQALGRESFSEKEAEIKALFSSAWPPEEEGTDDDEPGNLD